MGDRTNRTPNPPHEPARQTLTDLGGLDPRAMRRARVRLALTATALTLVVGAIAIGVVRIASVNGTDPGVVAGDDQAPSQTPSPIPSALSVTPRPRDLPSTPGAWSRAWLEPPPRTGSVRSITAGDTGLVAVGAYFDGDDLADVWTSSDGRTWSHVPGKELGPGEIDDVTAGGPGFVAVGTELDRKSTRLNSSHSRASRMPSSA